MLQFNEQLNTLILCPAIQLSVEYLGKYHVEKDYLHVARGDMNYYSSTARE